MSVSVNQQGVLAGKVAVITGASRGIGDALARRYAMEGAKVVVSARTVGEGDHYLPGSINQTVADIRAAGGEAIAVKADLANAEDRQGLVDATMSAYGAIDILVNNAGIIKRTPLVDMEVADFEEVIKVDLVSPFIVSKAVVKGMMKRKSGKIINICSMMSELGRNTVGAYAAAKGGLKMPVSYTHLTLPTKA